jgi:hypothetical protein
VGDFARPVRLRLATGGRSFLLRFLGAFVNEKSTLPGKCLLAVLEVPPRTREWLGLWGLRILFTQGAGSSERLTLVIHITPAVEPFISKCLSHEFDLMTLSGSQATRGRVLGKGLMSQQ